jgi:glyoxylase-like metal-dependent hydrolase (beta-lactamase superfamily II)
MHRLSGLKPGPAKRERASLSTTSPSNASNPLLNDRNFTADYGRLEPVSPLIRRIVAHNPGPFTFFGTGTYVVGHGKVAVIDPGPDLPEHVVALLAGLAGEAVSHILITHTHLDHSPAAAALQAATAAPTHGFGPHGRHGETGESGADLAFSPDHRLGDGDGVEGPGWRLEAVHTPGHASNHLCFALPQEQALFSGDHVMGWSTTVVAPPDGDMAAYMRSLEKLQQRGDEVFWPTHGGPIRDPQRHISALIEHRLARRRAVLAALTARPATPAALVGQVYPGLDPRLTGAAAQSLLAHLIELGEAGLARETNGSWYRRD